MLRRPKTSAWLFAACLVIFVGFWGLALNGSFSMPSKASPKSRAERSGQTDYCDTTGNCPWWDYSGAWTAAFTAVLTVSTVLLWYVTWRSAQAAQKATEIATREFVSTHRPRLRIRLLKIEKLVVGEPIVIQYEVVNIGDTKATIITNEVTLSIGYAAGDGRESLDHTCQFHFADHILRGEAVVARKTMPLIFNRRWIKNDKDYIPPNWGDDRVRIIGVITYIDDNETIRRTGFYRICTQDINRFRLPDFDAATLADHEYED